jgi:H+/gluconate symporter-like permease
MEYAGSIGLVVATALIIYLALKGYSIMVIGPVCALIVVFSNKMDFTAAMFSAPNSFMMGLGGFIGKYFIVFLLGSILAKYIEDSGAALSIARSMLKITGDNNRYGVLLALTLIAAILTYGGVTMFVVVFAMIPLARPLFEKLDMPWHLVMIPVALGAATFTLTMMPGTPSVQNYIPTTLLHTTLTAGALVGLLGAVVTILFGLWYMKRSLNLSISAKESYSGPAVQSGAAAEKPLPSLWLSLTPLVVLIIIIFAGSALKIENILVPAMVLAIVMAAILLRKYIPSQTATLNSGAAQSITPVFFTAAAVGFGTVVAAAPGFTVISHAILGIKGNPLISLSIATNLLAVVTGSATGALGIIMEAFAKSFLALGVNPEAMHRIAVMSAAP